MFCSTSGVPQRAKPLPTFAATGLCLAFSLGLPLSALAQTPIDVKECLGLPSDSARLACYDKMAGRSAMSAMPASPVVEPGSPAATPEQPAATPATTQESDSFLARYWELDKGDKRGTFNYTAYRPNFFLPARIMKSVNRHPSSPTRGVASNLPRYQNSETKLQVSMRTKVLEDVFLPEADLWVGYTQQSTWQLWNHAESAPFRNTDYQPELLYVVPTPKNWQGLPFGWKWRMASLGLVHQSNGQTAQLSRSWNRVYGTVGLEKENLIATVRVENELAKSENQSDDNPDITHFMGRTELALTWSPGRSIASLVWRPSKSGRGSVELDWTYPVFNDRPDGLRWYVQGFQGYGETLLDYNFKQTSLGAGLAIFKF